MGSNQPLKRVWFAKHRNQAKFASFMLPLATIISYKFSSFLCSTMNFESVPVSNMHL